MSDKNNENYEWYQDDNIYLKMVTDIIYITSSFKTIQFK